MFKVVSSRLEGWSWRGILSFLTVVAGGFAVFFWRLASLTPGLSANEATARSGSSSLTAIFDNPINAPHKIVQFLLDKQWSGHIFMLRLPSAVFALIFLFCFFKLSTGWFGKAIGVFGSMIFASVPLFVISARQASSEIMFFSPVVLIWLYVWLLKTEKSKTAAWFLLLLSTALLLYTPGIIWWAAAAAVLTRKRIMAAIADVKPWVSAAGLLIFSLAVASIVWAGIDNHTLWRQVSLVPQSLTALNALKDSGWMALSLFIKTGQTNPLLIGHLPLLNILLAALIAFGVYAMQGAARAKAVFLVSSILFSIIAAGINDNVELLAYALPAAAIFIAAGLRYLYIEWRSIFPRNPVPKNFALALIALVALVQVYFGLRYSLIAWPHTAATKSSYVLK